ncbi:exodeoxyribonuclease VII small subunit [Oryzomicrobium sp.]|uniref:exodeoxyribonuclease VII small subunit n=1 Tax=Oryzomicrobium sp. TaxID=1911578 RepID=UPI0025D282B2|nr:exodeoxyribonuclease VII small subunit [Oryzomicrobium sp.]MCE1241760.1 exodeoxyribonuclease VII small subunit [Oryzomicrobium sp.]
MDQPGTHTRKASPAAGDTAPSASGAPTFEDALAELERLVQGMEGGQLPLEASLEAYRRGMELLKLCQGQLAEAEQRIQVLEAGALRDLPAPGGAA